MGVEWVFKYRIHIARRAGPAPSSISTWVNGRRTVAGDVVRMRGMCTAMPGFFTSRDTLAMPVHALVQPETATMAVVASAYYYDTTTAEISDTTLQTPILVSL